MNLITNLEKRAKITRAIRTFFTNQGFLEVSTPLLVPNPSTEPYLEVFSTELATSDGLSKKAFLTTSPEYAMKKLIAEGIGSCFQICKSFRNNEGIGRSHNHEFTILEWYRTPGDYEDVMKDCENLVRYLASELNGDPDVINYQGTKINLKSPWIRLSIAEAFKKYLQMDENQVLDLKALSKKVIDLQLSSDQEISYDDAFQLLMLNVIEPSLSKSRPTFLYDYPLSQAALAKKKTTNTNWAERFELYIGGLEIGNAFSELADADEQLARMEADLKLRKKLGKKSFDVDFDLIKALKKGLPETGGIAVGVDRLVMLLLDAQEISQVIAFPITQLFNL